LPKCHSGHANEANFLLKYASFDFVHDRRLQAQDRGPNSASIRKGEKSVGINK
jgi:hypothetical protein